MQRFNNSEGKTIVESMIHTIQQNRDYLAEIDGLIGDGDHGYNMSKGFTICETRLQEGEPSFSDALDILGNVLFAEIGGSMGPIYGTIFMEMADSLQGKDAIEANDFLAILTAAIEGLETIIEAKVGDKTIMDTLVPARDAFAKAINEGNDFKTSLDAMVLAAEAGKEATIDMVARFGRSSRLGERSRGVVDAGATSCYLLLKAMAEGAVSILQAE